jgi:hypothetical protein
MKATLDIPDDLYRRVKARSALEGRPFRSVAVELLQAWLDAPSPAQTPSERVGPETKAPWLVITTRALRPSQRHDMESIRDAVAAGWTAEVKGRVPEGHRGVRQ